VSRARVAFAVAMGALAFIALACSGGGDERVYVFGDSLVTQSTTYLRGMLRDVDGIEARVESLAGSATCDWFANARKARDDFDPEVVVISFSGNALSPCMRRADGTPLNDREYRARYRAHTERLLDEFDDATVYLVGAPVSASGDDRVFRIYEDLARERDDVAFVDGGRYVTPEGRFVLTLPCLDVEPRCTGPVVESVRHNVVRTPSDRTHFCPQDAPPGAACPVYASGAWRFARAITEAVDR
jgi:hypothetical protein